MKDASTPEDWMAQYLDGVLSMEDGKRLQDWIKQDPAHARRFASLVAFDNGLGDLIRSQGMSGQQGPDAVTRGGGITPSRASGGIKTIVGTWTWVGFATALLTLIALGWWWANPAGLQAKDELQRLIDSPSLFRDRTYLLRTLDQVPEEVDEKRPPLDGAILHVRPPESYVLVRKFPDGRLFWTGSDGQISWSMPPRGVVRVSKDPMRFRGPLPGNQQGIPFVDLRGDLVQLREAYQLRRLGVDATGKRGIGARKRSTEFRGPNEVELWFDAETGVVHRMVFIGLPRAKGGPDRVSVDLVDIKDLGNEFFRHEAHLDGDRRVIEED